MVTRPMICRGWHASIAIPIVLEATQRHHHREVAGMVRPAARFYAATSGIAGGILTGGGGSKLWGDPSWDQRGPFVCTES